MDRRGPCDPMGSCKPDSTEPGDSVDEFLPDCKSAASLVCSNEGQGTKGAMICEWREEVVMGQKIRSKCAPSMLGCKSSALIGLQHCLAE